MSSLEGRVVSYGEEEDEGEEAEEEDEKESKPITTHSVRDWYRTYFIEPTTNNTKR